MCKNKCAQDLFTLMVVEKKFISIQLLYQLQGTNLTCGKIVKLSSEKDCLINGSHIALREEKLL